MCDMNHEYLIKGSPRVLTKVARVINKFRSEYGDSDRGRYFKPVIANNDGSLSWSVWESVNMMDLDEELAALTHRNATTIWAYHGETSDDYIEGYLLVMEKGSSREAGFWNDDVGFDSAMAAFELGQSPSVEAAMVLLEDLERQCNQPGRMSAVLAEMLLSALLDHPSLAANDAIWTRVTKLQSQIVASDINSEMAGGDSDLDPMRVRRLLAQLEAIKLETGLTEPTGQACLPKAVRL